jgi:ABC-type uncharacterized transport system substrate-binding protein
VKWVIWIPEHCQTSKAEALYAVEDPIFFAHGTALLDLASKARLPTIHELRRWPEHGALISYGPDLHDLFYRSASYVDRIPKVPSRQIYPSSSQPSSSW